MTPWEERWLLKGLSPRKTHTFLYLDAEGRPIVRKQRFALMDVSDGRWTGDKTFLVSHRSVPSVVLGAMMWENGIGDRGHGLMYNLPFVEQQALDGGEIWWTEGERDADAMGEVGCVATTHYQGSAGAHEHQAKVLEGASCVNIVMDNDNVGVQIAWYHAGLLRSAGYSGAVKVWRPPAECKDVQMLLAGGSGVGDLVSVSRRSLAALSEQVGPLPRTVGGDWGYEARELDGAVGLMIEQSGWKVRVQK